MKVISQRSVIVFALENISTRSKTHPIHETTPRTLPKALSAACRGHSQLLEVLLAQEDKGGPSVA